MKIAWYLESKKSCDAREIFLRNPGMSGTEYKTLELIWLLSQRTDIEQILFCSVEHILWAHGSEVKQELAGDIFEGAGLAEKKGCDIYVLGYNSCYKASLYKKLELTKIKKIVWAHNFIDVEVGKKLSECVSVKAVVCVGQQQLEMMRNTKIYDKSTYIYLPCNTVKYNRPKCGEKWVVYQGTLSRYKGFLELAKIWPVISKLCPFARLGVVGGNVFGYDLKLGKYCITEEKYENAIMKYLTDSKGNIRKDVKFYGVLGGREKENVIRKACVGIANPTALSETFCVSAVEFEMLGIPVVAKAKNSFFEVIRNFQTGFLFKTRIGFILYIVLLLKISKLNLRMGKNGHNFVKEKFSYKHVLNEWLQLLNDINDDRTIKTRHSNSINVVIHNLIWKNYFK